MSDELRAAVERIRSNKYPQCNNPSAYTEKDRDNGILANAYLAEHPSDAAEPCKWCGMTDAIAEMEMPPPPAADEELVTAEWLSATFGPHLASCCTKRYGLHFATDNFGRVIGWYQPCGDLCPCICLDEWVVVENPTCGDVHNLLKAFGVKPPPAAEPVDIHLKEGEEMSETCPKCGRLVTGMTCDPCAQNASVHLQGVIDLQTCIREQAAEIERCRSELAKQSMELLDRGIEIERLKNEVTGPVVKGATS